MPSGYCDRTCELCTHVMDVNGWQTTHKDVLRGEREEVLQALLDWTQLMSRPKLSATTPNATSPLTSVCTDDYEAAVGTFGYSCDECRSACKI